jgi:hypothetical protein
LGGAGLFSTIIGAGAGAVGVGAGGDTFIIGISSGKVDCPSFLSWKYVGK